MRYSLECICGYETPLVENEEDIDFELLEIHQEFCQAVIEYLKVEEEEG